LLDFYIDGGPASILDLNVNVAWASLVLVTPFYVGLYMYLDAIMPNVYGIRQSCCFCLKKKKLVPSFDDEEALDA
jgi:hypothetical protein